jgi:hypothetical protein
MVNYSPGSGIARKIAKPCLTTHFVVQTMRATPELFTTGLLCPVINSAPCKHSGIPIHR